MQRIFANRLKNVINPLRCQQLKFNLQTTTRTLATHKDIFEIKSDFPARHIGPRKTDVVYMLELLGYKVNLSSLKIHYLFSPIIINLFLSLFFFFSLSMNFQKKLYQKIFNYNVH